MPVQVGKGKKTETRFVSVPTGFSVLPEAGGVLDQPHHLMLLFSVFQEGERRAMSKSLQ